MPRQVYGLIGIECGSDMKTTYFVRHGSTDGNETGAYQLHTIPLSEKGLAQVVFIAERFKNIPVDVIISSDMTRAAQTADGIARAVGRIVVHSQPDFEDGVRAQKILDAVERASLSRTWESV